MQTPELGIPCHGGSLLARTADANLVWRQETCRPYDLAAGAADRLIHLYMALYVCGWTESLASYTLLSELKWRALVHSSAVALHCFQGEVCRKGHFVFPALYSNSYIYVLACRSLLLALFKF
jgi:hypothetical protein